LLITKVLNERRSVFSSTN